MIANNKISFLRFKRDKSGATAIEFAMLFPIFCLIYIGAYESTKAYTLSKRISRVAGAISDIIARRESVNLQYINDVVIHTAEAMLQPYNLPRPFINAQSTYTYERANVDAPSNASPTIRVTALRTQRTWATTLWSWELDNVKCPFPRDGNTYTDQTLRKVTTLPPDDIMDNGYKSYNSSISGTRNNGVFIRTQIIYPYNMFSFAKSFLPEKMTTYVMQRNIFSRQRTPVMFERSGSTGTDAICTDCNVSTRCSNTL